MVRARPIDPLHGAAANGAVRVPVVEEEPPARQAAMGSRRDGSPLRVRAHRPAARERGEDARLRAQTVEPTRRDLLPC
jgi:hypothetical protein